MLYNVVLVSAVQQGESVTYFDLSLLLWIFFPIVCHHKALNRFPYVIQLFLISYLLNKKVILQYVTIWMNLKNIMLTETSQTLKDKMLSFHLYQILKSNQKITVLENEMMIVRGRGKERKESYFLIGLYFQFCKMKRVIWMYDGEVAH